MNKNTFIDQQTLFINFLNVLDGGDEKLKSIDNGWDFKTKTFKQNIN